MAFTCGFFNSQNGDRKYNAEQMASIFDGLIKDGVYDTIGEIFAVTPGTGMQVLVGSGRAWFDHTWNNNDAPYPLSITAADVSLPRYDAVVLETNHSDTVRTNRLRVLTGTPASTPIKPTMTSTANVKQHPLAYIKVTAGATAITQSMIEVVVGTSECPFVTGIIETAQIDALFQQWNGEFDAWFDNLKAQLSDNVVANLQNQIDQKVAKADVATAADIDAGTSNTKWVTPKGLKESTNLITRVYDRTLKSAGVIETVKNSGCVYKNMSFPYIFNMNTPFMPLKSNRYLIMYTAQEAGTWKIMAAIVDSDLNIIQKKSVTSITNTALVDRLDGGSPIAGEFAGGIVCGAHSSNDANAYVAAYYGHRNLLASRNITGSYAPLAKAGETDNMCYLSCWVNNGSGNGTEISYLTSDMPSSDNISSWSRRMVSESTFSTIIGAHGTKIYGYRFNNSTYVLTVNEYDVVTNTTTQLLSYNFGSNFEVCSLAFEYPYAYFEIVQNGNQVFSKTLRINVADRTNNLNNVLTSSTLTGIWFQHSSSGLIGVDDLHYYYSGRNQERLLRVNKSTLAIDVVSFGFDFTGKTISNQVLKDVEYRDYVLSVPDSQNDNRLHKLLFSDIANPVHFVFPSIIPSSYTRMAPVYGYKDTLIDGRCQISSNAFGTFSTKYPAIRCFIKEE